METTKTVSFQVDYVIVLFVDWFGKCFYLQFHFSPQEEKGAAEPSGVLGPIGAIVSYFIRMHALK